MEWTNEMTMMMVDGVRETLFMTLLSTIFGYLLGLPMGVALAVTDKNGIRPNAVVYKILDVTANVVRSIPFLILLILIMPVTKLLVGRSYGTAATVVPLTVAAAPFIGRMIESSINEVDRGVIEAAHDYHYESPSGGGQDIHSGRGDDCAGHNPGLFRNGRYCGRRRPG